MKVSDICGKAIESSDGKRGYVISVNAADGVVKCLLCADENENEFFVDVENVKISGSGLVYYDRESEIMNSTPIRLGRPVYDDEGKFLGTLTDFSFAKNRPAAAHVGNKKYPAANIAYGDVIIVKSGGRTLKSDVKKDGKVIIKKGTPITPEVLQTAQSEGEYVQTNLKSL